jgi:DNA polymerase-3 subunit beta
MKFETSARLLLSALKTVGAVVERRNTIPILGTVMFDGSAIRATNLDIEVTVAVPTAQATGKACVAFHPLVNLVRLLDGDDTVTIDADGSACNVRFPSGCYAIPALAANDFPDFPAGSQTVIEIDGEAMQRALSFTRRFVSTEETRYYLNGVCIDAKEAVATDGHRMGVHPLGFDGAPFEKCIIPTKAVDVLLSMPSAPQITIDTKCRLLLQSGGMSVKAKLIDGTYPDWRRVVPKPSSDASTTLTASRSKLARVMNRISKTLGTRTPYITLAFEKDRFAVTGQRVGEIGAQEFVSGAAVSGKGGMIGFNARYVRDLVNAFHRSDEIALTMTDEGSPSIWRDSGEACAVLMPSRIGDDKFAAEALAHWRAA